eukprot:c3936_g1_i1.p1 GENE.c3936_g1_i1~~c3936_g1_i1.p1  ORF type:complete len:560 (-),score=119.97 c3936_g1_i1:285-1964(-)
MGGKNTPFLPQEHKEEKMASKQVISVFVVLACCCFVVLEARVFTHHEQNHPTVTTTSKKHTTHHNKNNLFDLEVNPESIFNPNPKFLRQSSTEFCMDLSVDGYRDYLDPVNARCGCLCEGSECFTCPTTAREVIKEGGRVACEECPIRGKTPNACTSSDSTYTERNPLQIPVDLFDDCTHDEANNKVVCTKHCVDAKPCQTDKDGGPCGKLELNSKVIELGLESETVVAQVESTRTLDITCPTANPAFTLTQSGGSYFCERTISLPGSEVPLREVPRMCEARRSVKTGKGACFVEMDCPAVEIPPITGSLVCAPMTDDFLRPMFRSLAVEYAVAFDPISPAKDNTLKTCIYYCHAAMSKKDECASLAEVVVMNDGKLIWGGPAAYLNLPIANNPTALPKLNELLALISSCYANPVLANPEFLGKISYDSEQRTFTFTGSNTAMDKMISDRMYEGVDWETYTQFHIPLGLNKKVESALSDALISRDPNLSIQLAQVDSFVGITKAYTTNRETMPGGIQNCRYWAMMTSKRTIRALSRVASEVTLDSCVASCRRDHENKRA